MSFQISLLTVSPLTAVVVTLECAWFDRCMVAQLSISSGDKIAAAVFSFNHVERSAGSLSGASSIDGTSQAIDDGEEWW